MRSGRILHAAAAVAIMSTLTACGGTPQTQQNTAKVPITTASEEARAAYLEGRDLLEQLRFTDAYQYFVSATELDPEFALAWMRAAGTSPTTHEFFASMRHAVATAGGASEGEQMMIRAFEAAVNRDPETQRAQLEALVAAYPGDERAHNTYATFLFGQQEFESAIVEYRKAVAINPDFSQPYNQLGYSHRFLGEFGDAEKAFVRYIELIPDQPNPYDSYAELLMKMGRFEESIASYEKALSIEPTFIASYIGIANNFIFMGRTEDARGALSRIEDIARTGGELRQMRTWRAATYLHEGDVDGALAEMQSRYDIAAENDDRVAMSGDLNLMGDMLLEAGRNEEASARYEASLEMMEASEATDDIKEAVRRNDIYESARLALAARDLKSAENLADDYREAVALHNVRFEVQQSRQLDGLVALASGEPTAALFELANANQQNPQVLLLNALAFSAAGDREAARAACLQVVNFNQLNFNLAYVRGTAKKMLEELDHAR